MNSRKGKAARHPGKGMTTRSATLLPDDKANPIVDYILETFK